MVGVNVSEANQGLGRDPMEDPLHLHVLQRHVRDHDHVFLHCSAERSDTT